MQQQKINGNKKQQCITMRSQGIVTMHNNDEEKNSIK